MLEEIEKERADIKERQAELVKKKAKLDEIIERAKSNIVENSPAVRDSRGLCVLVLTVIAERRQERKEREGAQTSKSRCDGLCDVWPAHSCI